MGVAGCMCRRAWGTGRGHLITTRYLVFQISLATGGLRTRRDPRAEVAQADRGAAAKREMDGAGRVCGRREQGAPATPRIPNPESTCLHPPVR